MVARIAAKTSLPKPHKLRRILDVTVPRGRPSPLTTTFSQLLS
jgi:hypothetical protein